MGFLFQTAFKPTRFVWFAFGAGLFKHPAYREKTLRAIKGKKNVILIVRLHSSLIISKKRPFLHELN